MYREIVKKTTIDKRTKNIFIIFYLLVSYFPIGLNHLGRLVSFMVDDVMKLSSFGLLDGPAVDVPQECGSSSPSDILLSSVAPLFPNPRDFEAAKPAALADVSFVTNSSLMKVLLSTGPSFVSSTPKCNNAWGTH